MTSDLDRICEERGIELSYISGLGEQHVLSEDVKQALLDALGPEREAAPRLATIPDRCFLPDWLEHSRAWGVTVQLFGVRSERNQGIGDFEDAARLAELFGPFGADFLGINPVHALFLSNPNRTSPYFPSSRQFLNPLYIAPDRIPSAAETPPAREATLFRTCKHIDYVAVTQTKRRMLERAFAQGGRESDFAAFCDREEEALEEFATFEALSEWLSEQGHGVGWHTWPTAFRNPDTDDVIKFRQEHAGRIRFHKWLQWIAAAQLADAQRRALDAGMRIGLYLDLAVGVAPDGAATWSNPDVYARAARIGAPADLFNVNGQDWGLAPLKPSAQRGANSGFARDLSAAMRSAGAVRLDHAMGLKRLYWIPSGFDARRGGYIRYPLESSLDLLATLSQAARVIVIGEDLGTVPPGFRQVIEEAGLLGYRVLYFETEENGRFQPPRAYDPSMLACVSTHDLPPLAGWWSGHDIETRERLGKLNADEAPAAREARAREKKKLFDALAAEGLAGGLIDAPDTLTDDLLVALHVFLARTPCRLVAIQLEDLLGATEQVNLPGTDKEHRNWSLKLPLTLEEIADHLLTRRTLAAVARERPRASA